MLERLFGNPVIEKIFFYLLANKACYGSQLSKTFSIPLYSIQLALARLEDGDIIVASKVGKTVLFQFNPRYPFLKELLIFIEKAYSSLPQDLKEKYYEPVTRKRPRKRNKPLMLKEKQDY